MTVFPSGSQWTIQGNGYAGTVVSVGGGLRGLTYDGRDVLLGYPADEPAHAGIGQHLFPWPNRITDGKYSFAGRDQQLYLTEPARSNAIHGLTRWANWSRLDDGSDPAVVEAGHVLHGQPGYPHQLELRLSYRIDDGLTITAAATNVGATAAPYGYGAHPYLSVGRPIDECVLGFSAAQRLEVSERMSPTGLAPVAGSAYDFGTARVLGELEIDNAFTGLAESWSVSLTDPDTGVRSVLSGDTPWVQLYTGGAIGRTALAVEPMTCPPDAFVTGQDLVVLEPGQSHTTSFRVSA
ncbi:aldose 1-epimerase family protein [Kribbella sandramycini]|uniref:Aldose 1-epimerase n=1 Tax=Kribbella sandramycini TaxID=60450 RepID=A0A7Y4L3D1_9ACTN|nr:aldose 1-epimerase family protein [Kribbella sandramycini]MBB6571006.1 aldose 1-epimerase [Kribbella sandramycini]NOL43585.1 aldose 1-epimerase family protein [Kribbella sandramycini]